MFGKNRAYREIIWVTEKHFKCEDSYLTGHFKKYLIFRNCWTKLGHREEITQCFRRTVYFLQYKGCPQQVSNVDDGYLPYLYTVLPICKLKFGHKG